jgi:hypothetical protein
MLRLKINLRVRRRDVGRAIPSVRRTEQEKDYSCSRDWPHRSIRPTTSSAADPVPDARCGL